MEFNLISIGHLKNFKNIEILLRIFNSMTFEKGYSSKIDDQFSIHIAKDTEEELTALINLNIAIHKEELLESYIRLIFLKHPRRSDILWLYLKDDKNDKLVSTICLIPLEWQIQNANLPACEMEFVGTLEEYRGNNFIKILNELYEKIMEQNGYILSVIRGIPYYYRSLGYEYISSLDERIRIPVSKIPRAIDKKIKIRKANSNDLPSIESEYNKSHQNFYIFNKFDRKCFKFKYLNEEFDTEIRSTCIFEEEGELKNYFSIGLSYDKENYEIICPDLNERQMNVLLQFIINLGNFSKEDTLILSLNESSLLFSYIKSLGGFPFYSYGWQVKIPNLSRFFQLSKKIFEERLKRSEFRRLTKTVAISSYQETVKINFNNGKIESIEVEKGYPNPQTTDLRIPGALLFKLLLGDRTIGEINYIIKDALVTILSRSLIEIMFPKKLSLFESYT